MKPAVKKTSIVCLSAAICFAVLRFIQIFFCTDAVSGFFKKGYSALGTEISVVIAVLLFFCFLFGFTEKKVPKKFPQNTLSICIASAILGIFLIADLIFLPKTFSPPMWQNILFYFSGLITIFLLFIPALSLFFDFPFLKEISNTPIIAVLPLVFWMIRTFICFSFYTEVAILSETVFTIFSMISISFLLLYIAFFVNDFESVKTSKRFLPIFMASILCCVNSSVPQILLAAFGFKDSLHNLNINHFTFFGILIYLLVLYFNIFAEDNMKQKIKKHAKEPSIFKH